MWAAQYKTQRACFCNQFERIKETENSVETKRKDNNTVYTRSVDTSPEGGNVRTLKKASSRYIKHYRTQINWEIKDNRGIYSDNNYMRK